MTDKQALEAKAIREFYGDMVFILLGAASGVFALAWLVGGVI